MVLPQKPYIEQQFPLAQLPQTVPLLDDPQVPSVVTFAVDVEPAGAVDVTLEITGSPVNVVEVDDFTEDVFVVD